MTHPHSSSKIAFALSFLVCISLTMHQVESQDSVVPRIVEPGPDVQYRLQEMLIRAQPGEVIQLVEGVYRLQSQIDIATENLTIRGQGPDKTILSFQGQASGGQGIEATGNNFVLENLAVEDTAGNAVKIVGAKNVTLRNIRTEWTGPPSSNNGAYGIYPVQCQNVLMEQCSSYGASDAGLYVGQCRDVILRNCRAERNVAGIEIENTIGADVYDNITTNNAGGLLVFDLPGLQQRAGSGIRVFNNRVLNNNHDNFADPGGIVASVPPGTGVMIMATDRVEVFGNEIEGNQTASVLVLSYLSLERKLNDPNYDPTPHGISIHNNSIADGGKSPAGQLGQLLLPVFGKTLPDILWDGVTSADASGPAIFVKGNGPASFANMRLADLTPTNLLTGKYKVDREQLNYAVEMDALEEVQLQPHQPPTGKVSKAVQIYSQMPRLLSEYQLFEGPLAEQQPAKGVFVYQLNAELFSDYASKLRLVKMPNNTKVEYRDDGILEFPVGTVIAKSFSYPSSISAVDSSASIARQRLLETRIEFLDESGWYGASYLWNEEQTDANIALGGADRQVQWTDEKGETQSILYQIPNANQCITCHGQDKKFLPIGPTARNLSLAATDGRNQLHELSESGVLVGYQALAKHDEWPNLRDPHSGTTQTRARAWLDVNCAHCHSPAGSARTSGLDLRWDQDNLAKVGLWKTPVAAGPGSGGRKFGIVPGKPDESIIMHRLESTQPNAMMPNLGRTLVYNDGVALVRQWIESLPAERSKPSRKSP